ncbi:hypothetical protein JAAARDRAFT_56801 [Jaapia argillacea MUCL 33604]|uniref:Uncharacterized protein n=1 Tax=Jaapia argillacea MUCL 33604 TaxID=933084 RepID=A0A067PYH3_9AGAM|nr:hypothetical protein JAAARDRAFT_56801 [Jaapia argillacea MUCL 33604]
MSMFNFAAQQNAQQQGTYSQQQGLPFDVQALRHIHNPSFGYNLSPRSSAPSANSVPRSQRCLMDAFYVPPVAGTLTYQENVPRLPLTFQMGTEEITFHHNGTLGINLYRFLSEGSYVVDGARDPVMAGMHLSSTPLAIQWPGYDFVKQAFFTETSRRHIAKIVAHGIQRYFAEHVRFRPSAGNEKWTIGNVPNAVHFKDVYLTSVVLVGRTWLAQFTVLRRR